MLKSYLKFVLDRPVSRCVEDVVFSLKDFELPPFHEDRQLLIRTAEMRQAVCERFIRLCRSMTIELETELRRMDYREFLDTDYWNYLRDFVVTIRGMRCEGCGYKTTVLLDNLELHHISYDHRGSEWRHFEDLKVLCRVCHAQEQR